MRGFEPKDGSLGGAGLCKTGAVGAEVALVPGTSVSSASFTMRIFPPNMPGFGGGGRGFSIFGASTGFGTGFGASTLGGLDGVGMGAGTGAIGFGADRGEVGAETPAGFAGGLGAEAASARANGRHSLQ
jgi:hypothetical protein